MAEKANTDNLGMWGGDSGSSKGEPVPEIVNKAEDWRRYLTQYCPEELEKMYLTNPPILVIDYQKLAESDYPQLADDLNQNPGGPVGNNLPKDGGDIHDCLNTYFKCREGLPHLGHVYVKVINFPYRARIRDIKQVDTWRFVSIEGSVRKVTEIRPRMIEGVYICPAGHITRKRQREAKEVKPSECVVDGCTFKRLTRKERACTYVDSQKLLIQEYHDGLRAGEQPQSIEVEIMGGEDLGRVTAGNRVIIHGILRLRQRVSQGVLLTTMDPYIKCLGVERLEQDFDDIEITPEDIAEIQAFPETPGNFEKLRGCVAPVIYGNPEVKEALLFQLFGGITKIVSGSHLRGDINVFVVGDPAIAKSVLLRQVASIAPRALVTMGTGSTKAGLTATAVKDEFGEGRWSLEPGALVLGDLGIVCVDEVGKMDEVQLSGLLEAMEQQTVTVDKAGIHAVLMARCALLGAANPKHGRFDVMGAPFIEQVDIDAPLLSRFDLIFTLLDKPDPVKDTSIANQILAAQEVGQAMAQKEHGIKDDIPQDLYAAVTAPLDTLFVQKYIAYAKRNVFPRLTGAARAKLIEFYLTMRMRGTNGEMAITARQLMGLVRLAEASARARLSNEITIGDAERVIRVVMACLKQTAFNPVTGSFDIDATGLGGTVAHSARKVREEIEKQIKQQVDPETKKANIDSVMAAVEKTGVPKSVVQREYDNLKRSGEIIEPNSTTCKWFGR